MERKETEVENGKEDFGITNNIATSKHLTFIVCLAFLISSLYQYFYWSPFNVNIFLYLSIQDILTRSIVPIMITSGVIFGCFAAHMDSKKSKEYNYEDHPELKRKKELDDRLKIIFFVTLSLIIPILSGAILIILDHYIGIVILGLGLSNLLLVFFSLKGWTHYICQNTKLPIAVLAGISAMIFGSVGLGLSNSYSIKYGDNGINVQISSDHMDNGERVFIGEAGGLVFLLARSTGKITQIKRSDVNLLAAIPKNSNKE